MTRTLFRNALLAVLAVAVAGSTVAVVRAPDDAVSGSALDRFA